MKSATELPYIVMIESEAENVLKHREQHTELEKDLSLGILSLLEVVRYLEDNLKYKLYDN